MKRKSSATHVAGSVAPGFEGVRAQFTRNFIERGEIGAAIAVYWRGEKIVDLWGGRRTPDADAPWNGDTLVIVMSATKGLAAMALAIANARGWLDYDAPVARYWPEFAQNGKGSVTVRQLLGHEAGLVLLDERLTMEKVRDLDGMARLLARQKPAWPPGTRHGYHTLTLGFYMQEIMRRVDPAHRTIGRLFHDEIATPLGLTFYLGLPPLGVPSYFSLGFLRPGPAVAFGSSPRAFGSPGAGGSMAFADPDARLGYAYVMNKLDFYLQNDPREKALRDAVYRAIRDAS